MKTFLAVVLSLFIWTSKAVAVLGYGTAPAVNLPEVKPVWELGKDPVDPNFVNGKIEITGGIIRFDGTNSFSLPVQILGDQSEFTIEFEVKRAAGETRSGENLFLVSNLDENENKGFGIRCYSPPYNAGWLFINGYRAVEQRGFLNSQYQKYTILVRDNSLMLFQNGLLLALTDKIKPSEKMFKVGEAGKNRMTPFEVRNLRIYDTAQFPTGFDPGIVRMKTFSGDQYSIQRVEIKDPKLPRILVIGNSISMGYRNYITKYFKGKAYVDYWVGGGWIDPNSVRGENSVVKRAWRGVLSNGPYDVITWNAMTLHMWKSPERCPEETLAPNMTEVVEFLKELAPQTKIIWIRGTPARENLPDGTPTLDNPRNNRIVRYNRIVDEVMKKYGIPEVDLYSIAENQLHTVSKGSVDLVHWKPEVYQIMAQEIIKEIEKYLKVTD
ncbi:MAG: SGNH/GDSL hydrolase family protein [Mangrovibacterium sp.]